MSTIGPDLRSFLLADTDIAAAVGTSVHQNHVPETSETLYIWFSRRGRERERTINESAGNVAFREYWDLEVIGTSLGDVSDLADLVDALDSSSGTFGSGTVQVLFVEDQTDDYIPRGLNSDEGLHYSAFLIEILGYAAGA